MTPHAKNDPLERRSFFAAFAAISMLAALLAGCHQMCIDPAMEFTEIRIESRSADGRHYAHKTAIRSGGIRGGHFSIGPDAPHLVIKGTVWQS